MYDRVLCIVPHPDLQHLATSLVCLFSPKLMAFQVKHVKVKKTKTRRRQVFVRRNSRQKTEMQLEPPPISNYSN